MSPDTLERAKAHFIAGNQHFEAARHAQARSEYEAALALVPGRASVLANLGITLCCLGEWEAAIERLDAALLGDATNAEAWAALGICREARGDWSGAAHALRRAATLGASRASLCLSLAMCELRLDRPEAGLKALDEAIALDPGFAEAWSQRGHLLREVGQLAEAARCYREALQHGGDAELHRFYLAAVEDARDPPSPPANYARALFEEYADDFQAHLLAQLKYTAPQTLLAPLIGGGRRFAQVLDLGCGTGLCGQLLASHADAIDGVDLSQAMVQRAQAGGHYRRVVRGELLDFLREPGASADLIVSADVFIYVGALDAVFEAAAERLAPGGVFAFSVEQADPGRDLQLRPSLRYAHSRALIERLAAAHGLVVDRIEAGAIREDQRRPVMGWYAWLQRPPV